MQCVKVGTKCGLPNLVPYWIPFSTPSGPLLDPLWTPSGTPSGTLLDPYSSNAPTRKETKTNITCHIAKVSFVRPTKLTSNAN